MERSSSSIVSELGDAACKDGVGTDQPSNDRAYFSHLDPDANRIEPSQRALNLAAWLIETAWHPRACAADVPSMSDWPASPSGPSWSGLQLEPRETDPCCRAYQRDTCPGERATDRPTVEVR